MILFEEPKDVICEYRPCGCNGNCPLGLRDGNCPASSASASMWLIPKRETPADIPTHLELSLRPELV